MRISDWSSDLCSSDLGEAGYIHSLEKQRYDSAGNEIDKVCLTDRFFLGEPQMRGFDIRGIGPRVLRYYLADSDGNGVYTREDSKADTDDALGGRIYYMARAELEIPLGSGAKEMGLRPSVFVDAGAVFGLKDPVLTSSDGVCTNNTTGTRVGTEGKGKCTNGDRKSVGTGKGGEGRVDV